MTNYKEYIKKRYNKDYDKSFEGLRATFYYIALRNLSLEDILRKFHCSKILDIGTGTGLTLLYLAEKGFKIALSWIFPGIFNYIRYFFREGKIINENIGK